ncbi:unnamed protein product, partial [Amoebophrya sp. A25]
HQSALSAVSLSAGESSDSETRLQPAVEEVSIGSETDVLATTVPEDEAPLTRASESLLVSGRRWAGLTSDQMIEGRHAMDPGFESDISDPESDEEDDGTGHDHDAEMRHRQHKADFYGTPSHAEGHLQSPRAHSERQKSKRGRNTSEKSRTKRADVVDHDLHLQKKKFYHMDQHQSAVARKEAHTTQRPPPDEDAATLQHRLMKRDFYGDPHAVETDEEDRQERAER